MRGTCIYNGERWNVLDQNDSHTLIWLPGRKERWVNSDEAR